MEDVVHSSEIVPPPAPVRKRNSTKFIIGGVLILAAVAFLIVSSLQGTTQYFLTVEELLSRQSEMTGRQVRVSGVVLGDTIQMDNSTLDITFTVAHIPGDNKTVEAMGGMAEVLHKASLDSSLPRLKVIYNGVKPDLLKNEAQAIMTGRYGDDGVFHAEELLLKCPTKYEEALPEQAASK